MGLKTLYITLFITELRSSNLEMSTMTKFSINAMYHIPAPLALS